MHSLDSTAQSQMIHLPSGRFRYLSWGAERTEHPPMLLLHGITSSALSWVRVGPALADRYRVYALDQRGHGESIKPAQGAYSLRHSADDALAFLEALDLERPVLIGHSWGGAIAMVLASGMGSQQPVPPFSQVILEDPAHNFGQGDARQRAAFYTQDIGRPAHELRVEITASSLGWTEADIEGKIIALQQMTREAVVSIFADAGEAGDLLPLLAQIVAPTLLIRADATLGTTLNDAAWERAQQYLSAYSRAVQIPGATHNIHRSTFDAFMQVVNEFLYQEPSEP
ncbi:MAG TPA: alpha/beta hydrolase [Ktedonobacteraceae bacterium]|nr:alpha/beta hydrolase [Ktedonobacteraceae bacterium]